jgi:hypothetical protein
MERWGRGRNRKDGFHVLEKLLSIKTRYVEK